MGVYAGFDTDEVAPLASTNGWGEFGRWVDTLAGYTELKHLRQYGWCQDLTLLREQALDAATEHGPGNHDVIGVVASLLTALDENEDAAAIVITDGMKPGDK